MKKHKYTTPAHFAVIDINKHSDLPGDRHSSKHLIIPLTVGRLISVLNTEAITVDTGKIRVKIEAEAGFDPHRDIDVSSLRFGAAGAVNFGRGSKVLTSEKSGGDLVVMFDGRKSGIGPDHFAGKMLGKRTDGKLLFGCSRLPGVEYQQPLLSPLAPQFVYTDDGLEAYVEVQNFGQRTSADATLKLLVADDDGEQEIASNSVRSLKPLEKTMVRLVCSRSLPKASRQDITVRIESDGLKPESLEQTITMPRM